MTFDDAAKEALRSWIQPDTFDSGHWTDEKRYFNFVQAVWDANHKPFYEGELRELITHQIDLSGNNREKRYIEKKVNEWVRDARLISDFLAFSEEGS